MFFFQCWFDLRQNLKSRNIFIHFHCITLPHDDVKYNCSICLTFHQKRATNHKANERSLIYHVLQQELRTYFTRVTRFKNMQNKYKNVSVSYGLLFCIAVYLFVIIPNWLCALSIFTMSPFNYFRVFTKWFPEHKHSLIYGWGEREK